MKDKRGALTQSKHGRQSYEEMAFVVPAVCEWRNVLYVVSVADCSHKITFMSVTTLTSFLHSIHLRESGKRNSGFSQFSTWCTKFFIYFYIIHLLKSSTCFEQYTCSSSGGLIVSMQHLVSSLSVGDCPVHRCTGAQDSHPQRVTISDVA